MQGLYLPFQHLANLVSKVPRDVWMYQVAAEVSKLCM